MGIHGNQQEFFPPWHPGHAMYILKYKGFGANAPQIVQLNQAPPIYRTNLWGKISRVFPKKIESVRSGWIF